MTIFKGVETMDSGAPLQTVIDRSMTLFKGVETMDSGAPLQTVIDRSMTLFKGFFFLLTTMQWGAPG